MSNDLTPMVQVPETLWNALLKELVEKNPVIQIHQAAGLVSARHNQLHYNDSENEPVVDDKE